MSTPTHHTSGSSGGSPHAVVRNVQNIQQRIIALNTRYGHVLGRFNLALQRLSTHLAAERTPHNAVAWDTNATRLTEPVDRLGNELEELTAALDELVEQLANARKGLSATFGSPAVHQGIAGRSDPPG